MRYITLLLLCLLGSSYGYNLSGRVVGKNGEPIVGASLSLMGEKSWTSTDSLGAFSFSNEPFKQTFELDTTQKAKSSSKDIHFGAGGKALLWDSGLELEEIALISPTGRRVFHQKLSAITTAISLPNIGTGVYILSIKKGGEYHYKKFVNLPSLQKRHLTSFDVTQMVSVVDTLWGKGAASGDSITMRVQHDRYKTKIVTLREQQKSLKITLSDDESGAVFAEDSVFSYHVTIDDSTMNWLNKNAVKEEYVSCQLRFGDQEIGEVGICYQGSAFSLGENFDANGKTVPKVSFKLRFNKYDKKRRLFGQKKLILKACGVDDTQMKNRLCYALFNEMGIHAPRTAYCKLYINGEYEGLFLATEQIDGRFTKRRYPEHGDGNLYKEIWPGHSTGESVVVALKTNEDVADVSKWEQFTTALKAMDNSSFASEITNWIDIDYMLRFLVIELAVAQWDGIMGWYHDPQSGYTLNHNYYWYEEEQVGGKFWIVPWDYDNSFWSSDPLFEESGVPYWNTGSETCGTYSFLGHWVVSPTCDNFIALLGEEYWADFILVAREFLDNSFSVDNLHNKIDRWRDQIDEATKEDPNNNYDTWKQAVGSFKTDMALFRLKLEMRLDGVDTIALPPVDLTKFNKYRGLSLKEDNTFEFSSDIIQNGPLTTNSNVEADYFIDSDNPLSGEKSVCFDVTFTDVPGQPWNEWANLAFSFANSTEDIEDVDMIVVTLKSDKEKRVRIDLMSDEYPNPWGSLYGITVTVDTIAQNFQLRIPFFTYEAWDNQGDCKEAVLQNCRALRIAPMASRDSKGHLIDEKDSVKIWIDDIRFIKYDDL